MKSYHLSCIASQVLPSKNRPKRWNEKMEKELKVTVRFAKLESGGFLK